jgi:very-short-patch-repair endonuclease
MAKDWDDFKQVYRKRQQEFTEWRFKRLEEKVSSPIERIMLIALTDEFEQWEPRMTIEYQKKIDKYIVDFLLTYDSSENGIVKIIVECDGHDFHERTKEQAAHDKKRDRYFNERGYIVLRYTGSEIVRDPFNLTDTIYGIMVRKDGVLNDGS